jgi:hypothetical protein
MMMPKTLFPLDREERKNYVLKLFLSRERKDIPKHVCGYVIGFLDAIQFVDQRPSDDLNFEATELKDQG